jgi:hypothetical protein
MKKITMIVVASVVLFACSTVEAQFESILKLYNGYKTTKYFTLYFDSAATEKGAVRLGVGVGVGGNPGQALLQLDGWDGDFTGADYVTLRQDGWGQFILDQGADTAAFWFRMDGTSQMSIDEDSVWMKLVLVVDTVRGRKGVLDTLDLENSAQIHTIDGGVSR